MQYYVRPPMFTPKVSFTSVIVKEPWWKTFLFGYKCSECPFRHFTICVNIYGSRYCPYCSRVIKE